MLLMLLTSLPSLLFGCRRRDVAHGSLVLRYMWLSYYHLAASASAAASTAAGTAG